MTRKAELLELYLTILNKFTGFPPAGYQVCDLPNIVLAGKNEMLEAPSWTNMENPISHANEANTVVTVEISVSPVCFLDLDEFVLVTNLSCMRINFCSFNSSGWSGFSTRGKRYFPIKSHNHFSSLFCSVPITWDTCLFKVPLEVKKPRQKLPTPLHVFLTWF